MRYAVLLGLMVLTGCASTPTRYTKAGGTEEERERMLADCRVKQASVMAGVNDWGGIAVASTIRDNCMRAQGWVRAN